jgi:hypothetical protein
LGSKGSGYIDSVAQATTAHSKRSPVDNSNYGHAREINMVVACYYDIGRHLFISKNEKSCKFTIRVGIVVIKKNWGYL